MLVMGADAPAIFTAQGMASIGTVAQGLGVIGGVLLWGFGLWWLLLASLITVRYFRARVPFNLGWWGYTFPLGVYTLATLRLGATLHLGVFTVIGAVLIVALAGMWALVAAKTLEGGWRGNLFVSPCIASPN
jgi:tellurite resistance protein TehA-like permease